MSYRAGQGLYSLSLRVDQWYVWGIAGGKGTMVKVGGSRIE